MNKRRKVHTKKKVSARRYGEGLVYQQKSATKKRRYVISFPFGLQSYIKDMLYYEIKSFTLEEIYPTYAIFSTDIDIELIKKLPFASNVYLYVKRFTHKEMVSPESQLKWAVERSTFVNSLKELDYVFKTYRIFGQKKGETISLLPEYRDELIDKLYYYNRIKFESIYPDVEIWFIELNENVGLCAVRISSHRDYQSSLQKGELRPEIAYFLNFYAEPVVAGTLLDPFAGSGAIPFSAYKHFEYRQIIASDENVNRLIESKDTILEEQSQTSKKKQDLKVIACQATRLEKIGDSSVDRIVTDPPWGLYNKNVDTKFLYNSFLKVAEKKLKPYGKLIMLVGLSLYEEYFVNSEQASKESNENLKSLIDTGSFAMIDSIDIAIWGQAAKVIKFELQNK